ncbi:alpha-2-macroglobulin family protein [Flavihumibacter petaseus]|uniref:Alpha2-macroglobulin homolog n=1 Tax=Flavihumibacter petaseus NBRC 106054 TaxID=1220578 RepID=A0A0E9MYP8_9BACT|nr:alpha-2-macroglobulin [Flavihumibacter petaseus]GAO42536.1 alpha2-macroglobulin homolog [Flavihumibacter petaseus NBRC 106054]
MFTKPLRLLLACLAVITLSCNRSTVSVEFTNAGKPVQPLQNLTFRFNHPLVKDSLLNRWDSTAYIRFEPEIRGRFRWESPDLLVFSPAQPLKPATTYKAQFTKALLANSSFSGFDKGNEITFSTPGLSLESSLASWAVAEESSRRAVAQVSLHFNYAVDAAQLRDKLSVTADGKAVDYQAVTTGTTEDIQLRLPSLTPADKDVLLKVTLEKGLLPPGGSNPTTEAQASELLLPSPFVLLIQDLRTEHDGTVGKVYVTTSQPVEASTINSAVRFDPALKFSAEATDDGFVISSDAFKMEDAYEISLNNKLRGRLGGTLRESYKNSIAFGQLEPAISFEGSKGLYLSANGNRNIAVRITNVAKVKVIVSKIYESNLIAARRYGYYPDERGQENEEYEYESGGDATLGDIIYEQEIDTRSLPLSNGTRLFQFNITDRLPDDKGSYHIKIRSTEDYWINDSRFISLSDIGLITKEGRDKLFVFANSIQTAKALADVKVTVYGANNQLLGMGTTDADGVATIPYTRKPFAGFKPALVIAKTAGDFNYLLFSQSGVNTSRFEVGGKRLNSTGLDAYLYGERDIYRPGEQVHFAFIARNYQWQQPGEIPVKFKFLLPNGKELKNFRKTLDAEGGTDGSIDIPAAAITGTYTLEAYSGNDVLLTSMPFMIEEFVPDRIKVTTKLDQESLIASQKTLLSISAVNFFGPPAANRKYETEIQVKQQQFTSAKYRNYNFGLQNQTSFFDKDLREGTTNENGQSSEGYTVPELYKNIGLLQASFYTTVFDETGRPVSRKSVASIYTQDKFFGIGENGYDYFPLNQAIRFPLIALDKTGKLLSGAAATVTVIKTEYHTVLTKEGGYFRYDSQKEERNIAQQQVTVSGENAAFSFVPRTPGNYELRVAIPGSASYVAREFYSYGYWGGGQNDFEVNTEGEIDMALDKEKYAAGEKVKVLFKTPFSGRMLVTMEQDQVLSYQYVDVANRTATLDLPLTEAHLPNVYITATLFKPHTTSEIPLTVAHGFINVPLQDGSRRLATEIVAPASSRSRLTQKISVKAPAGSRVTLAAVDNGVLQVSGFNSPDPYAWFYSQRALGVNAYDIYPFLFPELAAKRSSSGGDADLKMDQRVNPMQNKRIKILSYWSGLSTVGGNGEASFNIEIPQFSGEVRLMAVAFKGNQFGAAEKTMKVADPLVLSTALPRFLSPRDTISVPVTLTNTTANGGNATATIRVEGPLQVLGEAATTVTLPANAEARAVFRVVAAPGIGAGKISIEVSTASGKYQDETDITVRPASTLQQLSGSGVLPAGAAKQVAIGTSDFLPGGKYKIVVSKSPVLEIGNQLGYLVQYPYGCTEQTVSAALPQLYFADLAALARRSALDNGGRAASTTVKPASMSTANVQEAIRKIKMRQLYTGAVTMWDNADTENWWASIYAAHFLLEAKKAGFDVEDGLLNGLLNYINGRLANKTMITYWYNRDQQKKIAPKEVAYSLYVLAIAGRPNIATMNYYKSRPEQLALDSKYLLAAAFALGGDKSRFREMLPSAFSGEESVAQTGGSFYSPVRDLAIALNALLEVDPQHPQVGSMARALVNQLKQRYWYSTQESAFAFLAMGKLAEISNRGNASGNITAGGKSVAKIDNNALSLDQGQLGSNNVSINNTGSASLYYWWQSEGISATGAYKEEDNYLKIRRRFFTRNGSPVSGNLFKQNDLIIVQLTLEKSYSGSIENVVLTDLLPAGFEIENPRTKEIPGMDWIKDGDTPTAFDVRDDRIHFFVNAHDSRQVYYYAVRAVSPGVFQMGPASADAMYNGEYHSYHGAGRIIVEQ